MILQTRSKDIIQNVNITQCIMTQCCLS